MLLSVLDKKYESYKVWGNNMKPNFRPVNFYISASSNSRNLYFYVLYFRTPYKITCIKMIHWKLNVDCHYLIESVLNIGEINNW